MSFIVFSHGNGFPASTYGALTRNLTARGFRVKALEKLGHNSAFPVTDNWPQLVDELAQFVRKAQGRSKTPPVLVGHSLGGLLSLMVACRHPELAHGVVLLDALAFGGLRATALGLMKGTPLMESFSPSGVSQKRRNHWPTRQAALAHFASKKVFAAWQRECLEDYVLGFEEDASGVHLAFKREVETEIYNTLPHNLDDLLKRHPIKCPVAFVGGLQSKEMKQTGLELVQAITKGRLHMMTGSHLFTMEHPKAAAAAVEAAILNFA